MTTITTTNTKQLYHITPDGPKPCNVTVGKCRYERHANSLEEANQLYAEIQGGNFGKGLSKGKKDLPLKEFSADSFYGELPPRAVQLKALNGVKDALEKENVTQLIAACGTGKTYMSRQLVAYFLNQENSQGLAAILTSSIKLARDMAAEFRPDAQGRYDKALGKYGKDYVVIEVHSDVSQSVDSLKAVRNSSGAIEASHIRDQILDAYTKGKKIILISTYDSCQKIEEAQRLIKEQEKEELKLDILIHDEAHNILGQQTPTTVTDSPNTSYVGFHNAIPGAIQAERRLYTTATPIIQELGDKGSTATLEEAQKIAEKILKDNEETRARATQEPGEEPTAAEKRAIAESRKLKKERITFYSTDTEIVGGVGGSISQEEAINASCLAKPRYELRQGQLKGNPKNFKNPGTMADGTLYESSDPKDLNPLIYGSIRSTITALTEDPTEVNPSFNVLAYTGSIAQAEAYRDNFSKVALAESGGMNLAEATREMNSPNPETRYRARARLLAEHATVRAAHSNSLKQDREEAFQMFQGHVFTAEDARKGWSPKARILANVDIFSEGVNISEIDTVVVADDSKTGEQAMTQVTGRALRESAGNSYKTVGRVIFPEVLDNEGKVINGGSVALAAYGATRVERSVALKKLKGETVEPDTKTTLRVYSPQGVELEEVSAREKGQGSFTSMEAIVAAAYIERTVQSLRQKSNKGQSSFIWDSATEEEKAAAVMGHLQNKAPKTGDYSNEVAQYLINQGGASKVMELRGNNKVLSAVLTASDLGALTPEVKKTLREKGVLTATTAETGITLKEKRKFLQDNPDIFERGYFSYINKQSLDNFFYKLFQTRQKAIREENKLSSSEEVNQKIIEEILGNDQLVEQAFAGLTDKKSIFRLSGKKDYRDPYGTLKENVKNGVARLEEEAKAKDAAAAESGEVTYRVAHNALTANGEINMSSINKIAQEVF